jgi:hypothetical protein
MLVDIRGQAPDKPGIVNTTPEISVSKNYSNYSNYSSNYSYSKSRV